VDFMPELMSGNNTPFYNDEVFRLVGAIPDLDKLYGGVEVYIEEDDDKWTFYVKQKKNIIILNRELFKSLIYLKNSSFDLPEQHQYLGLGTKVFVTQVRECVKHKIPEIRTFATNPFVWGRLGYNVDFDSSFKRKMKRSGFNDIENVNQLIQVPGGVDYWKKHNFSCDMVFDTRNGSESLKILHNYVKNKLIADLKLYGINK
jgi:beta-xylosidase